MDKQLAKKCIFLDSSNIIRQINDTANITKARIDYHQLKHDICLFDQNKQYNSYYEKLIALLEAKVIDIVITYETECIAVNDRACDIIQLYKLSNDQKSGNKKIYLNQSINHSVFFTAAQEILTATKIVVDPLFLDFQVGISLSNYIKSSCQVISLGKRIMLQKYENEITIINQTPDKYVEELLNGINHFN